MHPNSTFRGHSLFFFEIIEEDATSVPGKALSKVVLLYPKCFNVSARIGWDGRLLKISVMIPGRWSSPCVGTKL